VGKDKKKKPLEFAPVARHPPKGTRAAFLSSVVGGDETKEGKEHLAQKLRGVIFIG
jgi:hypothetical protein